MKEINSTFINKLTSLLWIPMNRVIDDNFKIRSVIRNQLEWKLHDKLEDRIKFKVMIPLNWRINTSL
jgi:hypothetical protein